jgi:YD repeat-containing protein
MPPSEFVYDEAGRMIQLDDPKSQMTEWRFDAAGQLLQNKWVRFFRFLRNPMDPRLQPFCGSLIDAFQNG